MSTKAYRVGRPVFLAMLLLLFILAAGAAIFALRATDVLREALDGRRERETHTHLSQFSLREQMNMEQASARVRGWQSIAESEIVSLSVSGGKLYAGLFSPVRQMEDSPWAIVLHGGLGTDSMQVLDVVCALSLEGYRVLAPDLRAHGTSTGKIASLGLVDALDVLAWIEWIELEDMDARIVIFGQDEGGVAALHAATQELPQSVAAVAADGAYVSVQARAHELLAEVKSGVLDRYLFDTAYRVVHGIAITEGDLREKLFGVKLPLLLIHGTGDEEVLAWQSEEIWSAAGESAQLLLVEGAAHGMARFLEPDRYYDTLLGFFKEALNE